MNYDQFRGGQSPGGYQRGGFNRSQPQRGGQIRQPGRFDQQSTGGRSEGEM